MVCELWVPSSHSGWSPWHFPGTCFGPHWTLTQLQSSGVLCLWAAWMLYANKPAGHSEHALWDRLCSKACPLSPGILLTKHQFHEEASWSFKVTHRTKPTAGLFWAWNPVWLPRLHTHEPPPTALVCSRHRLTAQATEPAAQGMQNRPNGVLSLPTMLLDSPKFFSRHTWAKRNTKQFHLLTC
jgi:hypothetical protein